MQRRQCLKNPNVFCYICGNFVVKKQRHKPWAPHTVCSVCVEDLRNWTKGKKKALRFGIPMVWRLVDDCYFCVCKLKGFSTKNKKEITYPNLPSAIRPVLHGPDIPVPNSSKQLHTLEAESSATPNHHQRNLKMVPTHMAHLIVSPKLN
jgi:hypothetical protein